MSKNQPPQHPPQTPQNQQTQTSLNLRTTQDIQAISRKGEEKSKFFFIRRMPHRHVDREWNPPSNEQYEQDMLVEGFITPALLQRPISEELKVDLRELNQHLLPHFWRVNQRARFYQNRFYQYQWAFILAAFFTTAFAAVNVFVYAQGWAGKWDFGITHLRWTEFLGLITAIISGIAAAVSFLDANETPQKRWFKARAQAEALRSIYFLYLARQKPFDTLNTGDRVQIMRRRVIEILRGARGTQADQPPDTLEAYTPIEAIEAGIMEAGGPADEEAKLPHEDSKSSTPASRRKTEDK